MSETVKIKFKFKIGQVVYMKTASYDFNSRPMKFLITERFSQECHGGTQMLYRLHGNKLDSNNMFPEIILSKEFPKYDDWQERRAEYDDGQYMDHMFEKHGCNPKPNLVPRVRRRPDESDDDYESRRQEEVWGKHKDETLDEFHDRKERESKEKATRPPGDKAIDDNTRGLDPVYNDDWEEDPNNPGAWMKKSKSSISEVDMAKRRAEEDIRIQEQTHDVETNKQVDKDEDDGSGEGVTT